MKSLWNCTPQELVEDSRIPACPIVLISRSRKDGRVDFRIARQDVDYTCLRWFRSSSGITLLRISEPEWRARHKELYLRGTDHTKDLDTLTATQDEWKSICSAVGEANEFLLGREAVGGAE